MFERPIALCLLLASVLIVAPAVLAVVRGSEKLLAAVISAGLRLIAFILLVLMLAGLRVPVRTVARRMAVVIAVDQSRSIAPDQAMWMQHRASELRHHLGYDDEIAVVGFGRDASLLTALQDPRLPITTSLTKVDPNGTDLAGALTTALGIFPESAEKRLVLLTDGNQTQGEVLDELPAMSQAGVRIFTASPPPSAIPRVAITSFQAPSTVRAETSFAVHLDIENEARAPVNGQIRLSNDGTPVGAQQVSLAPGLNRLMLPYRASRPGAYLLRVDLGVSPPSVVVNPIAETALSVI